MIVGLAPRTRVNPTPSPVPSAVARIRPAARKSRTHLGELARAEGTHLSYADIQAFAWWYGGGWLTLNRGKKGLRRIHRGAEDVTRVRR